MGGGGRHENKLSQNVKDRFAKDSVCLWWGFRYRQWFRLFSSRPSGLNRLVGNESITRFPVGINNLSPLFIPFAFFSFRPLGLNRSVETRPSTPKKYQPRRGCPSATLHRRDRVQSWRNASFVGIFFLPSFANLRHAVICQERRLFHLGIRIGGERFFAPSMLQTKFQTENYCKLTKTKNNRWTNLSQSCCWLGWVRTRCRHSSLGNLLMA